MIAETEACPGERILVSNEDLAHFLPMPAGDGRSWGEALRDAAAGRFAVTVIVYVRRQDFLKESIFAQSVKAWYSGDIRDIGHYDFDLDGKLRALEAIFGRDRVRPIVYDDVGRGDIVAPFLAALGLDLDQAWLAPVGRENASMHRRKLLFLGGFPKPAAAEHADNAAARFPAGFVARVLAGSAAVADDGGRFLLSPAERHALVAAHLDGQPGAGRPPRHRRPGRLRRAARPGGALDPAGADHPARGRRGLARVARRRPRRPRPAARRLARRPAGAAVRGDGGAQPPGPPGTRRGRRRLMRRLYLHVGLHKTGTSFLQRLLLENRDAARRRRPRARAVPGPVRLAPSDRRGDRPRRPRGGPRPRRRGARARGC